MSRKEQIRKILRASRYLYILCYVSAAAGLLAGLLAPAAVKPAFLLCGLLLAVYFIYTYRYNRCPECGHVIRIGNPLREPDSCPFCGLKLNDPEDLTS